MKKRCTETSYNGNFKLESQTMKLSPFYLHFLLLLYLGMELNRLSSDYKGNLFANFVGNSVGGCIDFGLKLLIQKRCTKASKHPFPYKNIDMNECPDMIAFFHVFRQRDRSVSQRRAAEEDRRMAVEEALDELMASDTHYRRELNVQISSRIAVAEGKRRARTEELKEVC